jgi:hypothetical protein
MWMATQDLTSSPGNLFTRRLLQSLGRRKGITQVWQHLFYQFMGWIIPSRFGDSSNSLSADMDFSYF